ncbi:MAG: MarR family transcriptional regulator [Proteobacteria bacterium]|jgi:MarR family transcriptional regulator, lower aerobic nicotinate degradation pathway regulator|nr:MarR family transcriptional regulator [Pseudomonadota bacterium]
MIKKKNALSEYDDIEFSDKDKLARNAGYLLRRAFKRARKKMLNRISDHNLTPMQTSALHALVENGPTSQNKLGRYIGMEPGNVHGLAERLSKKNLITSRKDENDARHYVLELTEKGKLTASEVLPLRYLASEDILAPLTDKERKKFLELIVKLT